MDRVTQKCSTILIAIGDETRVFHSVEEIPSELREKLLESTRGMNSATILIADRGGREEILRALHSPQPEFSRRLAASLAGRQAAMRGRWRQAGATWRYLGGAVAAGCLGYLLWLLATLAR
ncbi:MAG: hypothetical protein KIT09_00160 [Bryobacteraceae bacterium]|nr:hypothetical protein [Bryobacteraceae bacterium]